MPWLHYWGTDLELCLFVEPVRLLGGPSSGSSVCRPGRLDLLLGASLSGVLKASLAVGFSLGGAGTSLDWVISSKSLLVGCKRKEKKRLRKSCPAACIKERSLN
eukprot:1153802-Pelagomonas_calceolata.AAC.1